MLHQEAREISFRHQRDIQHAFREVLAIDGIAHFSLDLVNPNGEMIFLSSTPSHANEICKRGYSKYDGIISDSYYRNYEFYWWKDACHRAFADRIQLIREDVLGLYHGFMLVRQWNDFYLMYSFAAGQHDETFIGYVINHINTFLRLGDQAYNNLCDLYSLYTVPFKPPRIDCFYPFQGGKPVPRYTADYPIQNRDILTPDTNVVRINFADKQKF